MEATELANMALAHDGKPTIDNIDDETESARVCKAFLAPTRQLFIKQAKLHITRKEVALALATGETSVRYDYIYGLPADCLHPIKIWNGSSSAAPVLYEIETHSDLNSSIVKTDEETPTLIYCVDLPNFNRFFIDDIFAMSYLLASFIAMPLKVDTQLKGIMQENYAVALSVSIANDQNSQSVEIINDERYSSIVDSRN